MKDALAISSAYELGDKIRFEESVDEFGRVAAQSAKQTIMEKMRKQMREITYNDYKQHEGEIMQGTVERFDQRLDRKSTRLNSSHLKLSRMPSSA